MTGSQSIPSRTYSYGKGREREEEDYEEEEVISKNTMRGEIAARYIDFHSLPLVRSLGSTRWTAAGVSLLKRR